MILLQRQRQRRRHSIGTNERFALMLLSGLFLLLVSFRTPTAAAKRIDGEPFRFKRIYFIGGRCGDPLSWYSKYAEGGMETLQATAHVTEQICSWGEPQYEYFEDFHVKALRNVSKLAGNELNETLVITGGFGLEETGWALVADLLRRGMAYFHGPNFEFNFTKYNLTTDDVLYFHLHPDEHVSAAEQVGKELCRLKGGNSNLKLAKFYGIERLDYRINRVLQSFVENCPDSQYTVVWELNETQPMEPPFMFNVPPDVILAPTDHSARLLFDVAKAAWPKELYDRLSATGWDNDLTDLVEQRKILVTVDQMVFYPFQGIWQTMANLLDVVQNRGLNSTAAIQKELSLEDSLTLYSSTVTVSSDRVGFLLAGMLENYDVRSAPYPEVNVSTGLFDVSIVKFTPFEGTFEAVIWMRWTWSDPRLAWNSFLYNGTVKIGKDEIWHPPLFFENTLDHEELFEAPAILSNDGQVVLDVNLRATFLCQTTDDLRSFPFDAYSCPMDLGASSGMVLDSTLGFEVIESDPHFRTNTSVQVVHRHQQPGARRQMQVEEPPTDVEPAEEVVSYQLNFVRRPFTAWVRLIIPGILINSVGFMAFWVEALAESVALGITSLLCSLAFRETVEVPDTSNVTWSESFMLVNIVYQALVMLIIFFSYNTTIANKVQKWGKHLSGCTHRQQTNSQLDDEEMKEGPSPITDGSPISNDMVESNTSDDNLFSCESNDEKHPVLEEREGDWHPPASVASVDWIGRWIVVPSYVVVMLLMLTVGNMVF